MEKKIKVLLVEDDVFLRELCTKKFRSDGMDVTDKTDGEEALKVLEKEEFDIILLDIVLPSMDGFEVLEKIRKHENEKARKTPVVMLSNLGQDEDIERAVSLGANDFLIKAHFTTGEVVKKVRALLKQSELSER
jgi:DNA-binding response OmpR family regulator